MRMTGMTEFRGVIWRPLRPMAPRVQMVLMMTVKRAGALPEVVEIKVKDQGDQEDD